jgi:hypothetical protein
MRFASTCQSALQQNGVENSLRRNDLAIDVRFDIMVELHKVYECNALSLVEAVSSDKMLGNTTC